jgi:hypothetical protein
MTLHFDLKMVATVTAVLSLPVLATVISVAIRILRRSKDADRGT